MTCNEKESLINKEIYKIVKFLVANEISSIKIKKEASPHLNVFIKKTGWKVEKIIYENYYASGVSTLYLKECRGLKNGDFIKVWGKEYKITNAKYIVFDTHSTEDDQNDLR